MPESIADLHGSPMRIAAKIAVLCSSVLFIKDVTTAAASWAFASRATVGSSGLSASYSVFGLVLALLSKRSA